MPYAQVVVVAKASFAPTHSKNTKNHELNKLRNELQWITNECYVNWPCWIPRAGWSFGLGSISRTKIVAGHLGLRLELAAGHLGMRLRLVAGHLGMRLGLVAGHLGMRLGLVVRLLEYVQCNYFNLLRWSITALSSEQVDWKQVEGTGLGSSYNTCSEKVF